MTIQELISGKMDGERFTVAGYDGVAWCYVGVEAVADEDTEWTGEEIPTGMVLMVMVGDDRCFTIDPEDVEVIAEEDYCHECGQIGCKGDGR